jgi:hypothetical protein
VRTFYHVEVADTDEAEGLYRAGHDNIIEEGDEEWLETVAIEECE